MNKNIDMDNPPVKEMDLKPYENYKDSGIEWIGKIPRDWNLLPGYTVMKESYELNYGLKNQNLLSLSYGEIILKEIKMARGLVPASFETYQIVEKGNIIFRPTDLQNDKVSLRNAISNYNGIITNAYLNFKPLNGINSIFLNYLFRTLDNNKAIYGLGSGLRQNISFEDFKRFYFPIPPLPEQEAIADFLDKKTAEINKAVSLKERLIKLLEERKKIIIQNAVTKGVDDNVEYKDSGIEWIGDIPEHWEVRKVKFCSLINENTLSENTNKNFKFQYVDIGSVSYEIGIENTELFNYENAPSRARRIAKPGDTIISTVRTYLKAIAYIGKKESNYIYSTGFAIFEPLKKYLKNYYLSFVFKCDNFTEDVRKHSIGVSYPAINSSELKNLYIPLPPLHEQQEIVDYIEHEIEEIDKAIELQVAQIDKLKEYKAILINEVVTGKKRVIPA